MIRGFYTAAAGMLAQMQRQEMLTNNISNANTPGYKADQSSLRSFPNVLLSQLGGVDANGNPIGGLSTGVYMQEATPDFGLGTLQTTNVPTDMALIPSKVPGQGALLFSVKSADGSVHYTRDGHFSVDALGRLTTADGNLVLSSSGQPITLSSNDFQVDADGRITVNGAAASKIGVFYSSDPAAQLVKEGSDLFKANGTLPSADGNPAISYQVKQGYLEGSNVNLDQNMTDLMMAYRTFEANQKVLKTMDHTMDLVANQVGKIG